MFAVINFVQIMQLCPSQSVCLFVSLFLCYLQSYQHALMNFLVEWAWPSDKVFRIHCWSKSQLSMQQFF